MREERERERERVRIQECERETGLERKGESGWEREKE